MRALATAKRPAVRCLRVPTPARCKSDALANFYASRARDNGKTNLVMSPLYNPPLPVPKEPPQKEPEPNRLPREEPNWRIESTEALYSLLRIYSVEGRTIDCREIAHILVKEREQKPDLQIYNALILSNINTSEGAAWKVTELLDNMRSDGLQLDVQTCHAVLKVLAIHVDHLLRTSILEYMNQHWISLSNDGAHDVAAGLWREGLFEQALERMDMIERDGLRIHHWLWDMSVYILCEANEISEAYRIMRRRSDAGELNLSRSLWWFFLDKASGARHYAGTALAWTTQVNQKHINPSSGICTNVLATAARAPDAVMATEVFTHLSKRGTTFEPIQYELLMSTYLASDPPDVKRAITILTIMALEKLEPSPEDTRPLYLCLRERPTMVPEAFSALRELHNQGRKIPIAALNVIIECYVEQSNVAEGLKVYKQMHTLAPVSTGSQRTFANIETFNLLLKGCRMTEPVAAEQAAFLVSELLALRIKPTSLTYDRLILVLTQAGRDEFHKAAASEGSEARTALKANAAQLTDWAYRHFADMQALKWIPRFGTVELLSIVLARQGDQRCWDVLQAGEDFADDIDSWGKKGHWARKNVDKAWAAHQAEVEKTQPLENSDKDAYDDESIGTPSQAEASGTA